MELMIRNMGRTPDLGALDAAIVSIDATALVDLDIQSDSLRISSMLRDEEIANVLTHAGYVVLPHEIQRQPSECCGGCGG